MAIRSRESPNDNYVEAKIPLLPPGKYSVTYWARREFTTTNFSYYLFGIYNSADTDFVNCYVYNQANTLGGADTPGFGNENYIDNGWLAQVGETHWITWLFDTSSLTAWNNVRAFKDGVEISLTTGSQNGSSAYWPITMGPWLRHCNSRSLVNGWEGLFAEFNLMKGWPSTSEIKKIHSGYPAGLVIPRHRLIYYNPLRSIGDYDRISTQIPIYADQNSEQFLDDDYHPTTISLAKIESKKHLRQEVPPAAVTDLFPNTVFYDTFTDTNGTLIDSHTPDTHTFSYGWERLEGAEHPLDQLLMIIV